MSAVFSLARNGQLTEAPLVEFLRTSRIDVEEDHFTLLGEAARNGHPSVVELLIRHKADVNKRTRRSQTALHYATKAKSRRQQTVQALINGRADIDAPDDDGNTPLMVAITQQPDPAVARLLVQNGASTTRKNEYGKTAHDLADQSTNHAMRNALLPESEQVRGRSEFIDVIVNLVLFILAYVNSGMIKGVVKGTVSRLYNLTDTKPEPTIAKAIGSPTTVDDFKDNIRNFVTVENPELRQFFSREDDFLQKVAEKAVQLKDDPTNHLTAASEIKHLTTLALYQSILYCDDSGSMGYKDTTGGPSRQELVRNLVTRMTSIATRLVPDGGGVHLRFINKTPSYSSAYDNLNKDRIDRELRFQPHGSTMIGTELQGRILKPFLFDVFDRGGTLKRPLLIIFITDGSPYDESQEEFKRTIIKCIKALEQRGYQPEAVRFLVSRVGNDRNAADFFQRLQGDTAIERVVHCTSGPLDQQFIELHRNEKAIEQWLLRVLMSPITGRLSE